MNDNAEHKRTVAEIKAELKEAEARELEELKAKQKAVKPQYRFSLTITSRKQEILLDVDTESQYRFFDLIGFVINKEELSSVGKVPFEGSMTYLYNVNDSEFITPVGGGTIFTHDIECWKELNDFVILNSLGGDVTHIVTKYFPRNWGVGG